MDDFIADISFFTGNCYSCRYCENGLECPRNFTDILDKVDLGLQQMKMRKKIIDFLSSEQAVVKSWQIAHGMEGPSNAVMLFCR